MNPQYLHQISTVFGHFLHWQGSLGELQHKQWDCLPHSGLCYKSKGNSKKKPVYEKPMAVVYELKTIAIQLCVTRLMELGLEEEGLFRLSAGQAKVDMSKLLIISS